MTVSRRGSGRSIAIALALAMSAPAAAYATLYAVSGAGEAPSTLYELDPATGAVVATIGATGLSHVTGIACHPQTGVMYAVRNDPDELLTIDPATGAATIIGPTAAQIPDISFDSAGTLYGWNENGDDLITLDLGTGAASTVGECGCSTSSTGLAFDSNDNLFMKRSSSLNAMNVGSGTIASTVALTDGVDNMLAFDQNDTLYSGKRGAGFTLKTIDPATGAVTIVGSNAATDISAIAFCNVEPLDHFLFYKRKTTEGTPKFYGFDPVTLTDQFGIRTVKVVKPNQLGLPADKNSEGVNDPVTHLEEYKIAKVTPPFAPIANTRIVNQCNDILVEVKKPASLLVPTHKVLVPPVLPPLLGEHNVDHFLCYKVKEQTPLPKGIQVVVADQFQTRRYDLKKLVKLCNPVAKSGTPSISSGPNKGNPKPITPAQIRHPIDHLACYKVKMAKKFIAQTGCGPTTPGDTGTPLGQAPHSPISGLYTNNQFGPERHDTVKPNELCLPSYKDPVCGDGVVDQQSEECDGSDADACPGGCLINCLCPVCGNGTIEPPLEQCEPTDDSACPGSCTACQCEGALRLADGFNAMEGRVEVFHAGQWGTVCDDSFDNVDATVACQQLGFSSGVATCCAPYGPGVDPIWMDTVACTGAESRLVDCPFNGFGIHDCSHGEDVGVVCTP